MENITSEQQLKELLNEGKINEDEYEELRDTLKKKPVYHEDSSKNFEKNNVNSKLGKIAVVLTLAGIILPFPCYFIIDSIAPPNAEAAIGPWFALGLAMELVALYLGIKSWRTDNGKAAAIVSGTIIFLAALLTVLNAT
jgi:hypothetical protein